MNILCILKDSVYDTLDKACLQQTPLNWKAQEFPNNLNHTIIEHKATSVLEVLVFFVLSSSQSYKRTFQSNLVTLLWCQRRAEFCAVSHRQCVNILDYNPIFKFVVHCSLPSVLLDPKFTLVQKYKGLLSFYAHIYIYIYIYIYI